MQYRIKIVTFGSEVQEYIPQYRDLLTLGLWFNFKAYTGYDSYKTVSFANETQARGFLDERLRRMKMAKVASVKYKPYP